MNIGDVKPSSRFFLAPLAGFSDGAMRLICSEMGAGLCYTEMVSAKGLYYNSPGTSELLHIYEGEGKLGFQIFGSDPDMIAYAVRTLDHMSSVLIDINMGCPVPKVVKNGEGAALMKDASLAAKLVSAAVKETNKPITVKIRAGWDAQSINAPEFAKALEDAGAAAVCVHGRTREQYYSGESDLEVIAAVKRAIRIPVIGNGDVRSGHDAASMMDKTGCDFVMVGRGAVGNPWIFADAIKLYNSHEAGDLRPQDDEPYSISGQASRAACDQALLNERINKRTNKRSPEQRADMYIRQLRLSMEYRGERMACLNMRKLTPKYFKGLTGVSSLTASINQLSSASEIILQVQEFISKLPAS